MTTSTHRLVGGAALLLGSVAFALSDLLRRVVEPGGTDPVAIAAAAGERSGLWLAASLLAAASAFLVVVGLPFVVRLAPARGATLTRIGAYLVGLGAIASLGHTVTYLGRYALLASTHADAPTITTVMKASDPLGGVLIALFLLGSLLGPILLTIGLRRAGAVPVWVPVAAVVYVVAASVSGVPAGLVMLVAALASLGVVALTTARGEPVRTTEPAPAVS